jgi:DNA-directed RNA polymerase subunit RPC12/RpoP
MIKPYECTQCGSTNFEDIDEKRVRCMNCGSLFQILLNEPKVIMNNDAIVTFGKNANVDIHGDIEVKSGANVDIQGKVTVLKSGEKQEFTLKLLSDRKKVNK